ncbi:MAG TPA: hypothetical protein VNU26_09415 [Mycobacteriales bacterium]|nr:hypothetical protein [Mycobacteriales bacterium]
MPQKVFDDAAVREAMRSYLAAADALDDAAGVGGQARDLLELAEQKAMAGLLLRKALERHGWAPPARAVARDADTEAPQPTAG